MSNFTAREGVLLTDAEIDELLAIHSRSDVRHALIDGPWCEADYDEWPCATVRALTNLRAARAVNDWHEAIMHTARLMLQRAADDPVQLELRDLLADELANVDDAAKGAGDGE